MAAMRSMVTVTAMATMRAVSRIDFLVTTLALIVSGVACGQTELAPESSALSAPAPRTEPPLKVGVRSVLTVSDNADTRPSNAEHKAGGVLEITPYAHAHVSRPDRYLDLSYSLRNFYRSLDHQSDLARHDLRTQGETAVAGDWLRFGARAYVYDIINNPFGLVSADPAAQSSNRTRFSSLNLSPVIRGEAADNSRYELRYGFDDTRFGNALPHSRGNRFTGLIVRSPLYGGLGWGAAYDSDRRQFDQSVSVEVARGWFGPFFHPIRDLRIGVNASYAKNSLLIDSSGGNSSWGPGFNALWTPSSRSVASLNVFRASYGTVAHMRLSVRQRQWVLGLRFDQDVTTGLASVINYIDPLNVLRPIKDDAQELDSVRQELSDRGILPAFTSPLVNTTVNSALVRNRTLTASADYADRGDSIIFSASYANRSAVGGTELVPGANALFADIRQISALLEWYRNLNTAVAIGTFARYQKSDANAASLHSKTSVFGASVNIALARQTKLKILIRHTQQRVEGTASTGFSENALITTLDYRF